jgi:hypothetical protein
VANFGYFYAYSAIRGAYILRNNGSDDIGTGMELLLGAASGASSQLFTLPIAVVTTRCVCVCLSTYIFCRQQTIPSEEKQSFADTVTTILNEEDGIQGLWKGLKASLVLCVNPAITYGCFEKLKGILLTRRGGGNLSAMDAFIIGAISKTLATVFTCISTNLTNS